MKAFTLVCVTSAMIMVSLAHPVDRWYYQPGYKKSVAIGGDAGDGGDAVAVGADVTAGVGGAAVGGTGFNLNKGYQAGGDGLGKVTAANGAAGVVIGHGGTIDGHFDNDADGGDGGNGGNAYAH